MKGSKFRWYLLLASLGFIIAIGIGLFVFNQSRRMMQNYSVLSNTFQDEHIEYLYQVTLSEMTAYIENQYPILYDPERLRQEAGTDLFIETTEDWRRIAKIFNFAYIYYITKEGDHYLYVMTSDLQKQEEEHPEWHNGQLWEGDAPDFINKAWETKQFTVSLEPTVNEWGKLISAARPVIKDGKEIGILCIDYDISFMDSRMQQKLELEKQESMLLNRTRDILLFSVFAIIVFMTFQIWLSNTVVMVPLRDAEVEQRTRLMLEATPMLCALWDEEGNLIDCTEETLRIFGLSKKSDYVGHFYDLNPEYQPNGESTRESVLRLIKETLETGRTRVEWMTHTAAGDPLPVERTVVRVPWKNGYRFAVYSRDLREEKAREAALLESENRLRVMLDTMAFACIFFDSKGNPLDCNKRAINLFGCENKEELLEKFLTFSPYFQPDGQQSIKLIEEVVQRANETGSTVFLWKHIKRDGSPLPVEIHAIRVEWKDEYRLIAYIKDLSDLVETEDNLRRVLATAEASPNFTFFLGSEGNIEYVNPAVLTGSGFSQDELNREGLTLLFSPEDYQRLKNEYLAAALKEENVNFEITLVAKNGEKRDFYFSAFAVQMYDWSTGVGLIGRDISEEKQIQRNLAIAKDQAERALAAEVKYNQAKSDFLSRVSHELRTPLNAIVGMTSIAKKINKNREEDQYFAKIEDSTEHLLELIEDILDMAGIDTGHFDFIAAPFSFRNAMDSIVDSITQRAKAKAQVFDVHIDDEIHDWVLSDERRLKQVLMNLLVNAVKFTPERGLIKLSAKMLENDENEFTVRFEVYDNGIGISQEALERLWNVFEQADNSITREHGGMGLGLSLTKRIVEMMNGQIRVESEPGKGSCFSCELRLGIAEEPEKNTDGTGEAAAVTEETSAIINLAGKRILIVDDVEINRDLLFAILEDTGATLEGACNGEEAVSKFLQTKYDLVLLDLHMPVMDGFTAAKNMRASIQPWAKNTPIISVSAESSVELHWKCLEAGINEHLAKPIEIEALYGIISKWMLRTMTAPGTIS